VDFRPAKKTAGKRRHSGDGQIKDSIFYLFSIEFITPGLLSRLCFCVEEFFVRLQIRDFRFYISNHKQSTIQMARRISFEF